MQFRVRIQSLVVCHLWKNLWRTFVYSRTAGKIECFFKDFSNQTLMIIFSEFLYPSAAHVCRTLCAAGICNSCAVWFTENIPFRISISLRGSLLRYLRYLGSQSRLSQQRIENILKGEGEVVYLAQVAKISVIGLLIQTSILVLTLPKLGLAPQPRWASYTTSQLD